MQPRIVIVPPKNLVGRHLSMSFAHPRTMELFKSFMPYRKSIENVADNKVYSLQFYGKHFNYLELNPDMQFEKWAAVEVSDFGSMPEGMETYTLQGGLYAVFHYIGSSADARIFDYIFKTWLPQSVYDLDHREHFEILGDKYKNNDPASEEDIYIPVRAKLS